MNGTCNYMLTRMINDGVNYDEILKEAQATGDNVVENEVNKAYDNIKSALMQTYGISPDQSEEILALQDDTEYTIRLQEIAGVR